MGVLQSNASNWIAVKLIFVHPVSKGIWKTLIKCLLGFFGGWEEMNKRGLSPWTQLQGELSMPGPACREGLRLVSLGSAEPSELGAPHGGLS